MLLDILKYFSGILNHFDIYSDNLTGFFWRSVWIRCGPNRWARHSVRLPTGFLFVLFQIPTPYNNLRSSEVLTGRGACRSTVPPSSSYSLQHSRHGCILVTRVVIASTAATPSRGHVLNQQLRTVCDGETIVPIPMDSNVLGTNHPRVSGAILHFQAQ